MENQTISRQALYELVWKEPIVKLSKQFNVAENDIRKACKAANIPLPPNGYWIKLQFGKEPPTEDLPISTDLGDITLQTIQTEEKPAYLIVPDKLINPDKLIVTSKIYLTETAHYNPHRYNGMASSREKGLDIVVMPSNVNRALLFMDTLVKAAKTRGHEIYIRNQNTYIKASGFEYKIFLKERSTRIPPKEKYGFSVLEPTGLLYFRLDNYYGRDWIDGRIKIEEQLLSIFQKIETVAAKRQEEKIWYDQQDALRQMEENIKKATFEEKQKELKDFKQLVSDAERWEKANKVRQYIKAIESHALTTDEISEELTKWVNWAKAKADWYDPLVEAENDFLMEVDRESLTFK